VPLVFGAIAPHGFPIIPELSDDAGGALVTRAAMEEMGRRFQAARPEVIFIAGPHGVRVDGAICLADVSRAAGRLNWEARVVEMNIPVDGALTDGITEAARARGVPIALAAYAGNRRSQSTLPLDWGLITPLWFLGHGRNAVGKGDVLADPPDSDSGPPVVIAAPSRSLPRASIVDFGRAVAEAALNDGRRVAMIASCDWAHTHHADGPYGFHPAAATVDDFVVTAVRDGELGRLVDLDERQAEEAAIDGLWQALMLAGALQRTPMRHDLLSYEAPTYYGMLVATYGPVDA